MQVSAFWLQVLHQPQSPAVRGQEALARVCLAIEQVLNWERIGAFMICQYKYRENYLRNAPEHVLEVLARPSEEGSHDILMFGTQIGIICIQVRHIIGHHLVSTRNDH